MLNEADTRREFVVPKFCAVGWDTEPHRIGEQFTFTDGRIIVGSSAHLPLEQLAASILEKERKIIQIMERVKGLLEKGKA